MVIAPPTSEKYRALQLQDIPRIRNDHSERTASWFLLCRNCFPVVWVGSQRHQTLEVKIKIRLVWWEPFGTGDVAASCESQLWGVSLLIWLWGTQICFFGFFFPSKWIFRDIPIYNMISVKASYPVGIIWLWIASHFENHVVLWHLWRILGKAGVDTKQHGSRSG